MRRCTYERRHWNLFGDGNQRQEVMLQHLCQVHAVFRTRHKALSNEILGLAADLNVIWERVSDRLDLFVGLLYVLRLERRTSIQHCVENHADRPVINFVAMAAVRIEHLGRQVVGRAADCFLFFTWVENLGSESEVADFKLHALGEKEIAEFEVSVDNFLCMDILAGFHQLVDVVARFYFVQSLSSSHKIR